MTEPDILTPREACGCGLVLAALVALAVAAYLLCGCASYTVVAADREVVPLREVTKDTKDHEGTRRFEETEAGAAGGYVPDAVLVGVLGAG